MRFKTWLLAIGIVALASSALQAGHGHGGYRGHGGYYRGGPSFSFGFYAPPVVYAAPPPVVYAAPVYAPAPVYVAPPPAYYYPAPRASFGVATPGFGFYYGR